jgi:hypothetical protein
MSVGWLPKGDAACDNCAKVRFCTHDRRQAIQMMRAGGWRHMAGTTLGGEPFETILCPECTKGETRTTRTKVELEQDVLPLDFEAGREIIGRQGFSSR